MNDQSSLVNPESCDVVILGGTFDPAHAGTVDAIRQLLARKHVRLVVIAPTAQNPDKDRKASPIERRIAMINLILQAERLPVVSDVRGRGVYVADQYRYTRVYEFVDRWLADAPGSRLAWVVGPDIAETVSGWREWERLRQVLGIVVVQERIKLHATEIRAGRAQPHPAIRSFIESWHLYDEGRR